MEEYQLPLLKRTLEIIYEALSQYRSTGLKNLNAEEQIAEQTRMNNEYASAKGNKDKELDVLFSQPASIVRAQHNAWKQDKEDLDILLGKVQIMRRRLQGKEDNALVEDFLKEVMR